MKKAKSEELRPLYNREDLGTGVRGKYFESYQKGTNLVLLSPDVVKAFPTEEAVNEALRIYYKSCTEIYRPNKTLNRTCEKAAHQVAHWVAEKERGRKR